MKNQPTEKSNWSAKTINIDIDTGEIITKQERDKNYIIIKTKKNVQRAKYRSGGIITYTNECKRNPQREIQFNQ